MQLVSIPTTQANVALALREGRQSDSTRNMYDAPSPLGADSANAEAQMAGALLKSQASLRKAWDSIDPAHRSLQSRMSAYLRNATIGNSGYLLSEALRRFSVENAIGKVLPRADGVVASGPCFRVQIPYSFLSTKTRLEKDIKSRMRYLYLCQRKLILINAPFKVIIRPDLVTSNFVSDDLVVTMLLDISLVGYAKPAPLQLKQSYLAVRERYDYFTQGGAAMDLLAEAATSIRLNSIETVDPDYTRYMAGFHPVARTSGVEREITTVKPEEFSDFLRDQIEKLHGDFADPNTSLAYTDLLLNILRTLFNHGAYTAYTHSRVA